MSDATEPVDLDAARRHCERIVANRREDGGRCRQGGTCDCSEHQALRCIVALNRLAAHCRAAAAERDGLLQELEVLGGVGAVARDYATELERQRDSLEKERDALRHHLSNLLAVVHRDGGHRQAAVGDKQAAEEAEAVVVGLLGETDDRRRELDGLREAAVDLAARVAEFRQGALDPGAALAWLDMRLAEMTSDARPG